MSDGTIVRVSELHTHDEATNLVKNQGLVVVLAKTINTVRYKEATLIVRVHSQPTFPTGGSAMVALLASAPSAEDPANYFVDDASMLATLTLSASTVTEWPTLKRKTATSGLVGAVSVWLSFTQGSPAGSFKIPLSVDLALKGC